MQTILGQEESTRIYLLSWSKTLRNFGRSFPKIIDDLEGLLTDNRIFKQRNVEIGIVSKQEALDHSFSGVMLRGSGIPWDLRRSQPYEIYKDLDFKIQSEKMEIVTIVIFAD